MADYNSQNLSNVNVQGLQEINSSLNSFEKKELQKPTFTNKASSQRDITIDLTPFLETVEKNKYFTSTNETNNDNNNE